MGKGEGWGEGEGQGTGAGEGQGSGAADWNNSLFGCMNNCTNCLCGYFCWCCLSYQNAEKLGKSGIIHTLLSCVSPCIPAFLQVNFDQRKDVSWENASKFSYRKTIKAYKNNFTQFFRETS